MVMIYCFAGVSGGHLNPAVSLAIKFSVPGTRWSETLIYMAAQFLGGIMG